MLYERLADLEVTITAGDFERRTGDTTSEFTRTTTVISLSGAGETGRGEDVTYDEAAHDELLEEPPKMPLVEDEPLSAVSDRLERTDLFPAGAPDRPIFRNYRRWALESAALDLALRQADESLAGRLGLSYDPVRFVVSTRLGEPPTDDRVATWLDRDPSLEFKLDATAGWSDPLVDRLAGTDAVRIVDLKGQYEGTRVDQSPDPALYERVLEGLPTALIEDPAVTAETRPLLADHADRLSWDSPIHGVDSIEALPWEPDWLNVKPSRFGSLRSLLETIEYCRERDIRLYGGGQFELAVGREHLHALASLFYPEAPNDVAPRGYNVPEPPEALPGSPLEPPEDPVGLDWG